MSKNVSAFAIAAIALMTTPAALAAVEPGARGEENAPCQASTSEGDLVLESRFWSSGGDRAEVPFGRSAVIVGGLASGLGAPLAGATLEVREFLIGAGGGADDRVALPRIGFARTGGDGSYAFRMPAGPNREAIVSYGGLVACGLRYLSPARPTLEAGPRRTRNRGRAVRFRGRLPGPFAQGRVVVLQAWVGGRWSTFRHATTDRRGRFHARYRFRRTLRPTTYWFRALAPQQAGFPWMAGGSLPVSVGVRP